MNTTDRPIGLLLRTLDRLIEDRFDRALGDRNVTRRQWQLLHTLAAGDRTLDELTAAVQPFLATGETVHRHLEPLVEAGAVRGAYALTDSGRALHDDLVRAVGEIRDRTVAGLPDGEYQRTVATLEAMIGNLIQV
jgi:DNA-binding MarR family transcriptional regulator